MPLDAFLTFFGFINSSKFFWCKDKPKTKCKSFYLHKTTQENYLKKLKNDDYLKKINILSKYPDVLKMSNKEIIDIDEQRLKLNKLGLTEKDVTKIMKSKKRIQKGYAFKVKRPNFKIEFKKTIMKNSDMKCNFCGKEKDISKKNLLPTLDIDHIIPHRYKKDFDGQLNLDEIWNLQALCQNCHTSFDRSRDFRKKYIDKAYGQIEKELNRKKIPITKNELFEMRELRR